MVKVNSFQMKFGVHLLSGMENLQTFFEIFLSMFRVHTRFLKTTGLRGSYRTQFIVADLHEV